MDTNGCIDWLCWPDFSSDACFAALLGTKENGRWRLSPQDGEWRTSRRYRDHTLILETTFESEESVVRLIDFMPLRGKNSHVVRIVEGVRGKSKMRMELALRFDYGRTVPWVTRIKHGIRAIAGPNLTVLRSSVKVRGENLRHSQTSLIDEGDREWFTLSYGVSYEDYPAEIDAWWRLKRRKNSGALGVPASNTTANTGRCRRSLITLKAMTFLPTGGIIAAVTTSLPEAIGGVRNWDYRFCWLRDTTFTLLALANGGYYDEAAAWQDWLLRALAGSPDQVQIIYGLKGERQLHEWEIQWLPGYEEFSDP